MIRCLAALTFVLVGAAHAECPTSLERDFMKAHRLYMPAPVKEHWTWSRNLAIVESRCRADAVSAVGARGLLQIMPSTWRWWTNREPGDSIFEAKINIIVGVRHLAWNISQWTGRKRTDLQLGELGIASYNAGLGHILEAQSRCGWALTWDEIKTCLPSVTGDKARETINHVDKWKELM